MAKERIRALIGALGGAALVMTTVAVGLHAQKPAPADIAAKMSGTWKINRELSPSVRPPAPPRGGGMASAGGARLVLASMQRRGGGGGGGGMTTNADLTPEVLAARAAIRDLQAVPEVLTVKATADTIAFSDPRGERSYDINGKNAKMEVNGASVSVKTKWDKDAVRQEFSTPEMKLVKTWELDDSGHLVLKVRIESMTLNTADTKAVYDRQP
jgi:hypothetical protein